MVEKIPVKISSKNPTIYAIKNSDGLYSRGGCWVEWGKFPKTWGFGPFKNHLNLFWIDGYKFPTLKEEEEAKKDLDTYKHLYWKVMPNYFPNKNFLIKESFPYWDSQILEIDPNDLTILKSHNAPEWTWHNVFKPRYEKNNWHEKRYIDTVKAFCERHDIKWS